VIVYAPGVNVFVGLTVMLLKFPWEPPVRLVIVPDAVSTVTVAFGGSGGTGFPPPVLSEPSTLKFAVPWAIVLLIKLLNDGLALFTTSVPLFDIVVAPEVPLTVNV
jgi:hypothetical protein